MIAARCAYDLAGKLVCAPDQTAWGWLIFLLVVFWIGLIYWTHKIKRRRGEHDQ